MISGKKMLWLLGLTVSTWGSASASEAPLAPVPPPGNDTAATIVRSLGRPAPTHMAFSEARFLSVLDQPLVVSGELSWLGGDQLQRQVDRPQPETATIADGEVTQRRAGKRERHFSLKHAPQLQALLDSFVALLSGDASRLQQGFEIQTAGDPGARWTMTLKPRDARVAKTVASIAIDGDKDQPRCMRMGEADGDLAIDLLGALAAKMPAQPTRAGLLALCQGQH